MILRIQFCSGISLIIPNTVEFKSLCLNFFRLPPLKIWDMNSFRLRQSRALNSYTGEIKKDYVFQTLHCISTVQ